VGKGGDEPVAVVEEKVRKWSYPLKEEKGVSPRAALAELFNNQGHMITGRIAQPTTRKQQDHRRIAQPTTRKQQDHRQNRTTNHKKAATTTTTTTTTITTTKTTTTTVTTTVTPTTALLFVHHLYYSLYSIVCFHGPALYHPL
jgi:hypothetical protein